MTCSNLGLSNFLIILVIIIPPVRDIAVDDFQYPLKYIIIKVLMYQYLIPLWCGIFCKFSRHPIILLNINAAKAPGGSLNCDILIALLLTVSIIYCV